VNTMSTVYRQAYVFNAKAPNAAGQAAKVRAALAAEKRVGKYYDDLRANLRASALFWDHVAAYQRGNPKPGWFLDSDPATQLRKSVPIATNPDGTVTIDPASPSFGVGGTNGAPPPAATQPEANKLLEASSNPARPMRRGAIVAAAAATAAGLAWAFWPSKRRR